MNRKQKNAATKKNKLKNALIIMILYVRLSVILRETSKTDVKHVYKRMLKAHIKETVRDDY